MHPVDYRLPSEWEPQSATLLAWPYAGGDWHDVLEEIRDEYVRFIETVLQCQTLVLLVPPEDDDVHGRVGPRPGLRYVEVNYNDTWCRDFGPITLCNAGRRLALDFHFNGWGGRHEARLDNRVNTRLARNDLFTDFDFRQSLFELEGGAIECDGNGTLLINRHCMRARAPHLEDAEVDHELKTLLNVTRLLEIDVPPMPGDDTDGHIDTLARFTDPETIVFQTQADDDSTRRLNGQLELLRTANGRSYRLITLPRADDIEPGLAASYVNFVLVNGAVLVPAFGSRKDLAAREILSELFPDRLVKPVDARILVGQGGGPHCASMHIPATLA